MSVPPENFPFDPAEGLDAEGQVELLADAFASDNSAYIVNALRTVVRARGMGAVLLPLDENPRLDTLLGVVKALGYRLDVKRAGE